MKLCGPLLLRELADEIEKEGLWMSATLTGQAEPAILQPMTKLDFVNYLRKLAERLGEKAP